MGIKTDWLKMGILSSLPPWGTNNFNAFYVLTRFFKLPRYHWSQRDTTHSSPLRDIILLSGSLYKIASLEAINWSLIGILASCKGKWFFETVVIEPIFQHSRERHFQILSLCNLQPFEIFFVFVAFYNVNTVRWEMWFLFKWQKIHKLLAGNYFFFEIVVSWQNLPARVCLCEDQSPLLLRKNLWGKPLPWLDPIYHGHFDFEPSVFHTQWQHWNNKIT